MSSVATSGREHSVGKSFRKNAGIPAGLLVVFFGLSLKLTVTPDRHDVSVPLPDLKGVGLAIETWRTGTLHMHTQPRIHLAVGDQQGIYAEESNWSFVRQSALWANGNSTLADQIIMALKNAGLLANSGSFQTTTVINGVSYKMKLQTGGCGANCTGITASAYSGTKDFTNRLKLWRESDGKDTLEMLFDDVNDPAAGDGVLLTYRLGVLNSAVSDNESLIVESYISGATPSRKQTYSWGAPFWNSGPQAAQASDRGRVVLEERTIGVVGAGPSAAGICVRIAVRTVPFDSPCTGGTTTAAHYYALAYGQKTVDDLETTALSGIALNTLATNGQLCGLDILKHATFNSGGFLADGLAAGSIPSGYPDPNVDGGYPGVDALFNLINTNGRSATNDSFDDMRQVKLDGLNAIQFHPVGEAPGF